MSPGLFVVLTLLIPLGLVAFTSHTEMHQMREYHQLLVKKTQEMNLLDPLIGANPCVSSQLQEEFVITKAVVSFKIAQELSRTNPEHLNIRIADIQTAYKIYQKALRACIAVSE